MVLGIFSCLRRPLASPSTLPDPERPLLTDEDGYKPGCIFCNVSSENGFRIEYEDDELIVFRDRWPRAAEHLLIIPRRHLVGTVKQLTRADIPLLTKMESRARALRPELDVKLGFHIPPFSSVHHLHLHVLVPPFTSLGRVMYPVRGGPQDKKWGWFVTPSQIVAILEADARVGLRGSHGRRA